MKLTLIGVSKHAWKMFTGLFSAGAKLILWRLFLLIAVTTGTAYLFALTGGSGLAAIVLGFAITSILSYTLRDDILAIWRDLWNANWAEVKV